MNKALVPIAALFTSLTWAQSQTSSTSDNGRIGGVQSFRGAIIDARCVPSDRSDSASAAITAPSGFSTTEGQTNTQVNPSSTSQSGRSSDRTASSQASKRKSKESPDAQTGPN